MPFIFKLAIIYFCVVSLAAVVITVFDKAAAKRGAWRVPEVTLMLVGLFGGALAMYITMQIAMKEIQTKKCSRLHI